MVISECHDFGFVNFSVLTGVKSLPFLSNGKLEEIFLDRGEEVYGLDLYSL